MCDNEIDESSSCLTSTTKGIREEDLKIEKIDSPREVNEFLVAASYLLSYTNYFH